MPYRKREANRIDEENQRMIERIMKANPSIPLRKLEKDYKHHLSLKKLIQRSSPIPIEKLLHRKQKMFGEMESQILPPIEDGKKTASKESKVKRRSISENKASRSQDQREDKLSSTILQTS